MLQLIWGIIIILTRLLLQLILLTLTAMIVSDITSYLLLQFLVLVDSTVFIIITIFIFVLGYWFFWLGSPNLQNWNPENKVLKYIWNRYGGTLLVAFIIALITFLITTISFSIKVLEFSFPPLVIVFGVTISIFIAVVAYYGGKHLKN